MSVRPSADHHHMSHMSQNGHASSLGQYLWSLLHPDLSRRLLPRRKQERFLSLLSLPPELLNIAESLEAQKDINAFARTNKQLYALANDVLYRDNITEHDGRGIIDAARHGSSVAVQRLLDYGAEVDTTLEDKMTPLMIASMCGDLSTAKILVDHGADVQAVADCGRRYGKSGPPLLEAAAKGHDRMVEFLLRSDADISHQWSKHSNDDCSQEPGNALEAAVVSGHTSTVRLLVNRGISVDLYGHRASPLIAGAHTGKLEMVRLLLRLGANIEVVDDTLGTALLAAVAREPRDIVYLLLSSGANIHAVSPYTALETAQELDDDGWMEEFLREQGASDLTMDDIRMLYEMNNG
ncbi:ankyrin repeat-containing domain protein [Aspergillus multicolor]|uniref:ankyrin repeat domain-containing protein n=1 Tax=Aspergillus multicolor TaxID=41759 RepID=UPI003CCDDCF9